MKKVVSPVMVNKPKSTFYHIDFSFDQLRLGGSAFAQSLNKVGDDVPTVQNPEYFRDAFMAIQELVNKGLILAGHDISAGGLITTLLEMCFANVDGGMEINLDKIKCDDIVKILFAENPGVVIQVADKHKSEVKKILEDAGVGYVKIGVPTEERHILATFHDATYQFGIDYLRDVWYSTSYLLDRKQSMNGCAKNVLKTTNSSRWNSYSTSHSPANCHSSASTRTVVHQAVSRQPSSVKREPTVNVKWLTCCIWPAST